MDRGKLIRRALAECNALEGCKPAMLRGLGWPETFDCARALIDTMWDDLPRAFPADKQQLRAWCYELRAAIQQEHARHIGLFQLQSLLAKVRAYLIAKAEPPKTPEPEPEPEPEPAPPEQPKKRRFGIFKS